QQIKASNQMPSLRWVKSKSMHLTLHFLGEQDQSGVEKIIQAIQNIGAEFNAHTVKAGEWGAFPNLRNPRVIFFKLMDADILINLQKRLGQKLEKIRLDIDKRAWQTHITVARNKNNTGPMDLNLPELPRLAWEVSSFELMQSNLLPDGAEYEIIKSFYLGK
ncbi:RNA 2',3'-cyclic phosphodiesterase, partial [Patescibacteria group bacterium]|nr:RNA 2',3'-cyclic phosphodiesterase [Patescibacteria group bacterium]